MSGIAIKVQGLSKRYRIGTRQSYHRFTDLVTNMVAAPFRSLRNISKADSLGSESQSARPQSDDTFWALKDVSFEIPKGEIVGIIGRNGAGKSTLLKILSRITEPTEGRVEVRGRIGSLLEVGTGFHPELTGRDNIYLNGAILGMKRQEIKRKFDEIVAFAETEKFLDTLVKHYSSGMYMRLAFSVAAHLQPEILLVDEVLAVGDVQFQKKCIGRMSQVAKEGRTVLLVSHNLGTVRELCPHAIMLQQGHVVASGDSAEVLDQYLGTQKADTPEIMITAKDHLPGGRKILLTRIRLLNSAGESFSVHWLETIQIEFDVNVIEPVQNTLFGVSVRGPDGVYISTAHSSVRSADGVLQGIDLEPGLHTVRCELRNNLRPGLYRLDIGGCAIEDLGRSFFFNVHEAATLHVLDYSTDGLAANPYLAGVVEGSATWNLPVPAPARISSH